MEQKSSSIFDAVSGKQAIILATAAAGCLFSYFVYKSTVKEESEDEYEEIYNKRYKSI